MDLQIVIKLFVFHLHNSPIPSYIGDAVVVFHSVLFPDLSILKGVVEQKGKLTKHMQIHRKEAESVPTDFIIPDPHPHDNGEMGKGWEQGFKENSGVLKAFWKI